MTSLTRMYTFACFSGNPYVDPLYPERHGGTTAELDAVKLAVSRSETCFYVGDLYEAWALYQFGLLTLEVIKGNILHQENNGDEQAQAAARGLRLATKAVESLTWL